MTIQVKITHGDTGHPAPFYVSKEHADGVPYSDPPIVVKDGEAVNLYVHPGVRLVITERPRGAV